MKKKNKTATSYSYLNNIDQRDMLAELIEAMK